MPLSFYDSAALCYSTPLDPCICNGDIVDFSVPTVSNELMREILGINTNKNTKETKKMEAKKCDRCGKLYETESANDMIDVLFKQEKISDSDKERYSEFYNNEMRTHSIRIRRCSEYSDKVDLCPDCRESFKRWFESGAGEV